jgi:hypothetical protein
MEAKPEPRTIRTVRLEIVRGADRIYLVATHEGGRRSVWDHCIKTERGAKRQLTIHAKRLGLTVNGDCAA